MKIWNPEVVRLANIIHDPNANVSARLEAAFLVGKMADDGAVTIDAPIDPNTKVHVDDLAEALVDNKPVKYVWRNGARIRVKS